MCRKNPLAGLALMLLISAILAGCSSKYGPQTTVVNHYPDCYQPVADMRASEFMVEEVTVVGAALGAVLGGVAGYLAGGGRGAAMGAIAGAAAGSVVANQFAQSAQEKNDLKRLAQYSQQLQQTAAGMDATAAAAHVASQCYQRQFEAAMDDFKNGRIDKEQFRSRYTEVASGLEETSRILGSAIDSVNEVSAMYTDALTQESSNLGVEPQVLIDMHQAAAAELRQPQPDAAKPASASRPRASRAASGLPQDVDNNLAGMVNSGAAMEKSLDGAKAVQDNIKAQLDLTSQMADDLLS
jgi:membrane protease subunit (stomatin/prohibitin family)